MPEGRCVMVVEEVGHKTYSEVKREGAEKNVK